MAAGAGQGGPRLSDQHQAAGVVSHGHQTGHVGETVFGGIAGKLLSRRIHSPRQCRQLPPPLQNDSGGG